MKLHLKIFLQIVLIFLVVFAFGGYWFVNTVDSIYENNVRQDVAIDQKRVQNEIEVVLQRIKDISFGVQSSENIIGSMNLISNYEDKQDYRNLIFDIQKQNILASLYRWGSNENFAISLYDAQKALVATRGHFGGKEKQGYVSYFNGDANFVAISRSETPPLKLQSDLIDSIQTRFERGYYIFSFVSTIVRGSELLGYVEVEYSLGKEELAKLQTFLITQIYFQTQSNNYILPKRVAKEDIEGFGNDAHYEVVSKLLYEADDSLFLMHIIDKTFIEQSKNEFMVQMIIFTSILLMVAFIFFWFFSQHSIIKPLKHLLESIDLIKKNQYKKVTYSSKDEIGQIVGIFNDIFEKLSQNYSFLQSYQTAVDRTNLVVFIDTKQKIKHVNLQFEKISSYSKDEICFKPFNSLLADEQIRVAIVDAMSAKRVWQGVIKHKTKFNTPYWCDTVVSPILDHNMQVKEYIMIQRDITKEQLIQNEKEKLQQKIKQQNHLLQSILETAPIGIWLNDQEGKPIMQNRWVTENTKMSKSEMQGSQATDRKTLNSDESLNFYETVSFSDGKKHIVQTIKTKLTNYKGELIGVLGIGVDVTEKMEQRKQLEKLNESLQSEVQKQIVEIREKDKMLQEQAKLAAMGEMISAIAHQWRQPLNALSINIQNLEEDYEDGLIDENFLEEFIEKQTQMIGFMSKTIDDFRDFFKTDKQKECFSMQEVISNVLSLVDAQLKHNHITTLVHGNDFEVDGYKSEMQQVVLNIISNAKDAIVANNDGGVIEIELVSSKRKIRICDDGGGVEENIIDRIFEPYFTTKEQGKGTGIGLHMSRTMVVEHIGGQMRAYNGEKGLCMEMAFEEKNE